MAVMAAMNKTLRGRRRPTTDMASSFEGPTIAGEGGDAKKGGGLAIAHGAEFAHPGDQGGGGDGSDAGHGGEDFDAFFQRGGRVP